MESLSAIKIVSIMSGGGRIRHTRDLSPRRLGSGRPERATARNGSPDRWTVGIHRTSEL